MSQPKYLSMDGRLVPYADATVHVLAPAITYGATVFEGIRGHWSEARDDCLLFRVEEHLERLAFSIKVMRFNFELVPAEVTRWMRELIQANGQKDDLHLRVLVYVAEGPNMLTQDPISLAIASLSRPGKKALVGIRGCVSNWRRISDDAMPPRVKCASNYQNGRLASLQAQMDMYDLPILLSQSGHVAEAPGSCIFMVRKGRLCTPAVSSDILEGITRDTVMDIATRRMGLPVYEREIDRSELYLADELFVCGTASEIVPITSMDGLPVGRGEVGPLTRQLATLYAATVRGDSDRPDWYTPVYREQPEHARVAA
jgi:branched-chain amino acid aminotransferase